MKHKKLLGLLLTVALSFSTLSACTPKETVETTSEISTTETLSTENISTEIIITDQIGREIVFEKPAEKLVSSYYISTAILVSLGLEDNLIGIEAKAETRGLYSLAASNLIDLPAIGTGKGVNIEEIAALEPDVVIVPKRLSDAVESFESLGIPVIVVNPETLDDFKECIAILAKITGADETAKKLLNYYDEKMELAASLTEGLENPPSVYLSAGSDYLSTCTSQMYQNDLIAIAGGDNVSKELTDGYWQMVSAEQINLWQPAYIFAVSYAEYTLDDIKADTAFSEIPAIKNDNLFIFPSAIEPWDYPTPSSVLGVLYLTHILHPDLYTQKQYVEEATSFYKEFFDIDVTLEDLGL